MIVRPDGNALFDEFNQRFFSGKIAKIPVVMNSRLKTSAGKCWGKFERRKDKYNSNPFLRERTIIWTVPTHIEIHSRLFDKVGWDYTQEGWSLSEFKVTLIHEMTHAFLFEHQNDRSHGSLFQRLMFQATGKDIDHTYHHLDVADWRKGSGVRKEANRVMAAGFNPFKGGVK